MSRRQENEEISTFETQAYEMCTSRYTVLCHIHPPKSPKIERKITNFKKAGPTRT